MRGQVTSVCSESRVETPRSIGCILPVLRSLLRCSLVPNTNMTGCDYLRPLFVSPQQQKAIIDRLVECIHDSGEQFEAIAFRGFSGALVAPMIAVMLEKKLIAVRKTEESSHAYGSIEGHADSSSYVIVDDFMDSGRTVEAIIDALSGKKPTALFFWNTDNYSYSGDQCEEFECQAYSVGRREYDTLTEYKFHDRPTKGE